MHTSFPDDGTCHLARDEEPETRLVRAPGPAAAPSAAATPSAAGPSEPLLRTHRITIRVSLHLQRIHRVKIRVI
jgi:hypothetical protein